MCAGGHFWWTTGGDCYLRLVISELLSQKIVIKSGTAASSFAQRTDIGSFFWSSNSLQSGTWRSVISYARPTIRNNKIPLRPSPSARVRTHTRVRTNVRTTTIVYNRNYWQYDTIKIRSKRNTFTADWRIEYQGFGRALSSNFYRII